ncbi:MAG: spermidine synthase [Gammaproteobacteria bacterium]|jgi:spermidine synthase|nr:spermidine synthase [Gammaproteobacteria bacterium]MBT3488551.1 spermidine synthase [Gammaproteobacteria bacterium]MBT3719370.1 spermidine synthase [Gammaproteobacteria bacterium]MBT3843718.1 spermidine synthase [Gammaproteobacteria bacterium]MBT3892274.1 spermidine synthase [Gammaproteobacteria bacterium]
MTFDFEELDYQETPLGEISLRRRAEPRLGGTIVYEVKLGDEFLMSSLFTESEIQLAKLGLAACEWNELDVVVGGLGLGYTAVAALEVSAVKSLMVIDVMEPVINWHKKGLVPLGKTLIADPRCSLILENFFEIATAESGFDRADPAKLFHAVLLDIDHSPSHWLNSQNRAFYSERGLQKLSDKLYPGGIFALWSNDPPDADFTELLDSVFLSSEFHIISFPNPYMGGESSCTVYVAHKASAIHNS